jgi:hypothetical protein
VSGRCRRHGREDRFPNAFEIFQHLIIPEAQNAIAVIRQPLIADGVAFVISVLTSVDFDHQPPLSANEIDNVRTNRLLANKFESA